MNLLVHTAAGVIVAQYTGSPFLAFFYGITSHILLDLVPHGDSLMYKRYKNKELSIKKAAAKTILDSIGSVILTIIFFNLDFTGPHLVLGMAIIGAIIPDVLIGLYELFEPKAPKLLKTVHKWHFRNHDLIAKKFDLSLKHGLLLQVIIFLLLMHKIF